MGPHTSELEHRLYSALNTLITRHPHVFHELVKEECDRNADLLAVPPGGRDSKGMMHPLLRLSLIVKKKLEDSSKHVLAPTENSQFNLDSISGEDKEIKLGDVDMDSLAIAGQLIGVTLSWYFTFHLTLLTISIYLTQTHPPGL